MSRAEERIFVGVLRVGLRVPGARTLKDRRQVVNSLRDRMRHRFDISFHEVGVGEDPQRQTFMVTTSGNDGQKIRSILDQCVGMVREHPVAEPAEVDVDVFRWEPSPQDWAARMMAELGRRQEHLASLQSLRSLRILWMNDLRRRRDARDIWISQRHLLAGLLLMMVAVVTSFVLGFLVGRDEAAETPVVAAPIGLPDDELIDLLARVEASALSDGGLEALTFPDALRGVPGGGPSVPEQPGGEGAEPHVRVVGPVSLPRSVPAPKEAPQMAADGPPSGQYTVVVGTSRALGEMRDLERTLASVGIEAWVGADIVEGKTTYKLAVGGFSTAEEAARVLPVVHAAGFSGTVQDLGPVSGKQASGKQ